MKNSDKQLKLRFLDAIVSGELGSVTDQGITVTLKEFRFYFNDIKTQYVSSFLPAATIDTGQTSITHTKFVFRIRKGVYLVHADAIDEHNTRHSDDFKIEETCLIYTNHHF